MVTVKIRTETAAFEEGLCSEAARILRVVALRIYQGDTSGDLFDVNGNHVGMFSVKPTTD